MRSFLLTVFVAAMMVGGFAVVSHLYALIALRRMGARVPGYLSGIPGVLTRQFGTLPPIPKVVRVARLSHWSDIAFAVAMFAGVISSMLLASHP